MTLHRIAGRVIAPFRVGLFNLYNLIFHVPRTRVIVWNEDGELLLVKSWGAQPYWGLPGGGVKKNERPIEAARRELYEEAALDVPQDKFSYVTTLHRGYEAPIFMVTVARGEIPSGLSMPRETVALGWFAVDELPTDLSPLVPLALRNLSKTN